MKTGKSKGDTGLVGGGWLAGWLIGVWLSSTLFVMAESLVGGGGRGFSLKTVVRVVGKERNKNGFLSFVVADEQTLVTWWMGGCLVGWATAIHLSTCRKEYLERKTVI